MEEKKTTFKEKLIAFWSVKRNKIITCSVGGLLVVGIVLAIVLPIALNQGNNQESSHTHTFASTWEHDETYHWHAATCGHDVVDGKVEHTFKDDIVDPTKDKDGYTNHICTVCDYSYQDSNVPSIQKQEALGMIPVIDNTNNTITYGLYPQTHVSDNDTITALNALTTAENNGWYLYNGAYYAKHTAHLYITDRYGTTTFSDGTEISEGTDYWFKCEPIEWKILTNSDGKYSLVSTVVLDASVYNADREQHKYEDSTIRSWLNDDFFKGAFNLNNSYISLTDVDNSATTTDSDTNPYAGGITSDNVYLLSFQDYNNDSYFSGPYSRKCLASDYAIANYCMSSNRYGVYMTRSPNSSTNSYVRSIQEDGYHVMMPFYERYLGVCPAITIKL